MHPALNITAFVHACSSHERAANERRKAIQWVRQNHPFEIMAIVLLPDHLHAVLELSHEDHD
jgi:REP element-mobilizing transposase RayT